MNKKALDILSRLLKEGAITKEEYLTLMNEFNKANMSELGIEEFGLNYVYDEEETKDCNDKFQHKSLFDFEIGNIEGKDNPNIYHDNTVC